MSRVRTWLKSLKRRFTALLEVVAQRKAERAKCWSDEQNIARRQNALLAQIVDARTTQHQQVMRALARIEDLQRRQGLALARLGAGGRPLAEGPLRDLFAAADAPSSGLGARGDAHVDPVGDRSWRIMPGRLGVDHPGFAAIRALGAGGSVAEADWRAALAHAEAEALADPAAEGLLADLESLAGSDAKGGSRRREEGLFLYWLTRAIKPAVVVQSGDDDVTSALIVLALDKNGGEGRLHLVAPPRAREPGDDAGATGGEVATIPMTRAPGRLASAAHGGRCTVREGEPRDVLGQVVASLDDIDLFVHADPCPDEDQLAHALASVYPKLARRWTIAARGGAGSGVLREFADERSVAGYDIAGALGVVLR